MKILAKTLPFLLLAVVLMPGTASAVADLSTGSIGLFVGNIISFINRILVPLVFAIAFLVFIWGMFQTFILGGGDEEKQSKGKQLMLYAIVGFVLMVSIWGIVNLVSSGFGLTDAAPTTIPSGPTTR
jgi:hypothetical protein